MPLITGYFHIHGRFEGFADLEIESLLNVLHVMQQSYEADVCQKLTFTDDRVDGKLLIRCLDLPTWQVIRDTIKLNIIGRGYTVELVGGSIGREKIDEELGDALLTWDFVQEKPTKQVKRGMLGRLKAIFGSKDAVLHEADAVGDIYPDFLDDELMEDDEWEEWDDEWEEWDDE